MVEVSHSSLSTRKVPPEAAPTGIEPVVQLPLVHHQQAALLPGRHAHDLAPQDRQLALILVRVGAQFSKTHPGAGLLLQAGGDGRNAAHRQDEPEDEPEGSMTWASSSPSRRGRCISAGLRVLVLILTQLAGDWPVGASYSWPAVAVAGFSRFSRPLPTA